MKEQVGAMSALRNDTWRRVGARIASSPFFVKTAVELRLIGRHGTVVHLLKNQFVSKRGGFQLSVETIDDLLYVQF